VQIEALTMFRNPKPATGDKVNPEDFDDNR
jgi:hypothetical protein